MRIRPVITTVVVIGAVYAGICALAWAFQDRLVWFPGPPPTTDPGRYGLDFDDLRLMTSDDIDLHAWFLPGAADRAVLISHGNGGTIENIVPLVKAFRDMGASVLVYDYRGYGDSAGSTSEEGTYRDAEAAFDWLLGQGFAPDQIVAYGHSLGGAVSIALATRRPVSKLIVENTFSSLTDIGAHSYPWLPVRLLSRIEYDSVARAPDVTAKALVIHSAQDEMIPIGMGRLLHDVLAGEKQFLETSGGHADGGFMLDLTSTRAVADFLDAE
ncbi:MAG: alpha/beta fold hydrolase [Pseudomonadota bacterium]